MVTVLDMMKRFERLDLPAVVSESVAETKVDFLAQQKEQLYAGKASDGKDIMPFYRPATIARKKKKGQPTDRVTLKDTGFFYSSLFLVTRKDGTFDIISSDVKSKWLMQRYGAKILGLGGEFRVQYIQQLTPEVLSKVHSILKL